MSCSSPGLVALEVDSEEDSAEPKSPLSPLSSDVEKSDEKGEMLHPSSDLTCTRSQSASSACEAATKVKTLSQAFRQTLLLISQVLCFRFHLFSRNWMTRGFDCARIPTPLPKSVCVPLVLPATTILHVSAPVSNSETDNFI